MAHDLSAAGAPSPGSVILYRDGPPRGRRERLRRAETIGPAIDDPVTGHLWFGVMLPDWFGVISPDMVVDRIGLVDATTVVNVAPPG